MSQTVEVKVDFIKQAFKAACNDWKRKILNEFPDLDLPCGPKRGELRKSTITSLVVYVTQTAFDNNFSGVVVVPDEEGSYPIGYVASSWDGSKSKIYDGEPIDVAKILGIK